MSKTVTATFKTRNAALDSITALEAIGITEEQVGMIVSDETRGKTFGIEKNSKTEEGTAKGGVAGGVLGGVLGALMSAGVVAIPGLNLVVSGYLVSAMAGLGTGAAAGGLMGGLIGAGFTEHEAKIYENEVINGAILLAVEAENSEQRDQIEEILKRQDAYNLAA